MKQMREYLIGLFEFYDKNEEICSLKSDTEIVDMYIEKMNIKEKYNDYDICIECNKKVHPLKLDKLLTKQNAI